MAITTMRLQQPDPDLDSLSQAIDTSGLGAWDYVTAAAILLCAIAFGRVLRFMLRRIMERTSADGFLGDLIGRLIGYVIVSFGLVYALDSLNIRVAPVLGALGIVGFALAFALKDILENFVAGILLQLRRPFTAGDQILSFGHEGTVLSIDARTVTIRTPDGDTVLLPSAEVMKHAIVNHTRNGSRRTTIEVGVAYDTDLDHARTIASAAASSVDGVLDVPEPEVLVHSFGASSIDMAVRFWHGPSIAEHWRVQDAVARAIARRFRENDIEIPFPQQVVHGLSVTADDRTDR